MALFLQRMLSREIHGSYAGKYLAIYSGIGRYRRDNVVPNRGAGRPRSYGIRQYSRHDGVPCAISALWYMDRGRLLRPLLAAGKLGGGMATLLRRNLGLDRLRLVLAKRRAVGLGLLPLRQLV
jgi:hypothetical protein